MTNEIQYKRLRNLPTRKSKKFVKWAKGKYPHKELHHLLGSMTGIKLNDYLLIPLTHEEHERAERQKIDTCIHRLPESLNLLFEYIEHLEEKV